MDLDAAVEDIIQAQLVSPRFHERAAIRHVLERTLAEARKEDGAGSEG